MVRMTHICIVSILFSHFEYFLAMNNVSSLSASACKMFFMIPELFVWCGGKFKDISSYKGKQINKKGTYSNMH